MPFGAIVGKAAAAAGKSKAFEHLGKIKTSQWKAMGKAFGEMSDFAKQGGVAKFIGGTVGTIKTRIENQVIGMFSPIINEVSQFTGDLLEEAAPLGTALGNLIGLLSDLSIQIGDVNISVLDLILGFPLLLKGLNSLLSIFEAPTLTPEQEQDIIDIFFPPDPFADLVGGHGDTANLGTIGTPSGPGAGFGGYQEF